MTIAVLDACVLYPPSLRDLLMWLASVNVYEPRWTEEIHAEWTRNVLADNPQITPAQLERTRREMNKVTPDCLVAGYEAHIPALNLPDANDRHVLAAAIEAQAPLIVTLNLSDFPAASLRLYRIRAVHPDPFLEGLMAENLELFLKAVQIHRASLRNPPKSVDAYLQTLRVNGLSELAVQLDTHRSRL